MKKILKYPIDLHMGDTHRILIPVDAVILDCQLQYDVPCIWVLCDPDSPTAHRHIAIYGTGHDMPDNPGRHISTIQFSGGRIVLHFFEVEE